MSTTAAAKKPKDRQPKMPSVRVVEGARVVTFHHLVEKDATGHAVLDHAEKPVQLKVEVRDEALDDWELLDELAQLDTNPSKLPSLLRRLVGDRYEVVIASLRNDNGRVPIVAGTDFIKALFGALNPS